MTPLSAIFIALVLLFVKHWICDFLLQTPYIMRNKQNYGHPGGLLHAGEHAVGSIPALAVLTGDPMIVLAVVLAEGVLHYHIDWAKEKITKGLALQPDRLTFWGVFGLDQLLHCLTYIGMVAYFAF